MHGKCYISDTPAPPPPQQHKIISPEELAAKASRDNDANFQTILANINEVLLKVVSFEPGEERYIWISTPWTGSKTNLIERISLALTNSNWLVGRIIPSDDLQGCRIWLTMPRT